ncbi:MAG: GspE/PulE family protein [Rhodocyclaceae bacterium]|nr:GspE/PulE family protein [Rhodocyclaceae bacterium]
MAQMRPIGELLKEAGIVTEEMITYALKIQKVSRERVGDVLLRLRFATDTEVGRIVAQQNNLPFDNLEGRIPQAEALAQLPFAVAQKLVILPLEIVDGCLLAATDNPGNPEIASRVGRFSNYPLRLTVASSSRLQRMIQQVYYMAEHPIAEEVERISGAILAGREFSAERLFDLLLSTAIDLHASDMHISPTPNATLVSYRVDGVLQLHHALPVTAHGRLVSTCKVRSGLDIAEANRAQDGRMRFTFLDGQFDLRISTMPAALGENLVVRFLSGGGELISLEDAGFNAEQQDLLRRMTVHPHGTILVTGPTGSGKTTTLYAMLRRINTMQKNVLTIEDPVEYEMPLVHQVEINEKAGVTFATAIRGFLRQDPDVMLVGEIRDQETAALAMRAAQTGHLVFSSLHTNDALSAIVRLRDLGVADYILSTSLIGLVAQRLLRRLCRHCKQPARPETADELWEGLPVASLFVHVGCPYCRDTGYSGRLAVGEVLVFDNDIRGLIDTGASGFQIEQAVQAKGMYRMRDAGHRMVAEGVTDVAEFLRVLAD